jgi:ABC-type sugar transport system permease subunit
MSAYLFLLPALVLFFSFVVYPIFFNLALSFNDWNGIRKSWTYIGLSNFAEALSDPVFTVSLRNIAIFSAGHVVTMVLALAVAVLLNNPYRGLGLARTIIFLPTVLAPTIIGVTWCTLLDPNIGPVNAILAKIGLGFAARPWLADPSLAIWVLNVVRIWAGLGFVMVLYLSSLQSIGREVIEAAEIDGANRWQVFWSITVPLLKGTHATQFMLGIIGAVKLFDLPYVMTSGGPYRTTYSLALQVYKSVFEWNRFGYGAAISQFLLVILLILTIAQRLILRDRSAQ